MLDLTYTQKKQKKIEFTIKLTDTLFPSNWEFSSLTIQFHCLHHFLRMQVSEYNAQRKTMFYSPGFSWIYLSTTDIHWYADRIYL